MLRQAVTFKLPASSNAPPFRYGAFICSGKLSIGDETQAPSAAGLRSGITNPGRWFLGPDMIPLAPTVRTQLSPSHTCTSINNNHQHPRLIVCDVHWPSSQAKARYYECSSLSRFISSHHSQARAHKSCRPVGLARSRHLHPSAMGSRANLEHHATWQGSRSRNCACPRVRAETH
jgi:hypothetical protein